MVTVCLNKPIDSVIRLLHASFGELNFLTFLGIVGHSLIALRPRFVHDVLYLKLPTLTLVGKPDSGKMFLVELTMLTIGNDRKSGRAFTYTHISEHELGKRCLKSTIPVLVNDPPRNNAAEYAQLVESVSEGNPRRTNALVERLKSRLLIIWFKEQVTFPEKDKDVYKQAQSLSAYLPDLLHFPEDELKGAVQRFNETLSDLASEDKDDSESHRRNLESLSLFYALRGTVAVDHIQKTALPTMSRHLNRNDTSSNESHEVTLDMIPQIIQDTVQYVFAHPNNEWFKRVRWSLQHSGKDAVSIRTVFNFGMFAKHENALRKMLKVNPEHGLHAKVNYRAPKSVINRGHQSQWSLVFYTNVFPVKLQHQLVALDVIARMTDYCYGWVTAAEQLFRRIEGTDESELVLNDIIQLAQDAVEKTASMPTTGCDKPLYIGRTAKPSTSSFATADSQHAATAQRGSIED
ncbi:hypothetical protein BV898_17214 [Hypsibius exemplaris]|uniref:Uncharacterized protein n=1 Tax=Hypsibius exemplaris TaxID=2072580 RepID=A0A9X6NHN0_HYPEX|nr:hypothetical protein BV898_17214 [Hypsibius exemplaris]